MLRFLIPSFMGKTTEVQTLRRKLHELQLDWIFSYNLDSKVYISVRDYKRSWYRDDKRIVYIKPDLPPGHVYAKNGLLSDFYESDDEWAVMLDNDTRLGNMHMGGRRVFNNMVSHPELWKPVDMWMAIDPMKEPFRFRWRKDPEIYSQYYHLKRIMLSTRGCMFVIRNPKTSMHKIKPVFFNDEVTSHIPDDYEFIVTSIIAGWASYNCTNCVIQTTNDTKKFTTLSYIFAGDTRNLYARDAKIALCKKLEGSGLSFKINEQTGRVRFETKRYWNKNWNHPKELIIDKRKERIE